MSKHLRRLTVAAVFLAIALVLRTFFAFYVPLFGETGMRVGISGIFSIMPSVLFGPFFGGLTSGLSDLLGFMLRPSGTYIPLMTVVVAGGGAIRGGLWLLLRKRDPAKLRIVAVGLAVIMLGFGAANHAMLRADGVTSDFYAAFEDSGEICTDDMFFISRWLVQRTQNVSDPPGMLSSMITTVVWGSIGAGLFFLALLGIDY